VLERMRERRDVCHTNVFFLVTFCEKRARKALVKSTHGFLPLQQLLDVLSMRLAQRFYRVCHVDLDEGGEMIIFESILTTFKSSVVFRGSWGSSVN